MVLVKYSNLLRTRAANMILAMWEDKYSMELWAAAFVPLQAAAAPTRWASHQPVSMAPSHSPTMAPAESR